MNAMRSVSKMTLDQNESSSIDNLCGPCCVEASNACPTGSVNETYMDGAHGRTRKHPDCQGSSRKGERGALGPALRSRIPGWKPCAGLTLTSAAMIPRRFGFHESRANSTWLDLQWKYVSRVRGSGIPRRCTHM